MTPASIYASAVLDVTRDLYQALKHIREVSFDVDDAKNTRVDVKEHLYANFDSSRMMGIWSVWFDGKPFMIFRHAGRDGRDSADRVITDKSLYNEMVTYLTTIIDEKWYELDNEDPERREIWPADAQIERLDNLYQYPLEIYNGTILVKGS